MSSQSLIRVALTVFCMSSAVLADLDALDWVSVAYVLNQTPDLRSTTRDAQAAIVRSAQKWGSQQSYSAVSDDVIPPSGDRHDYLSWAPYHWPDCHWCSKTGHSHLAHDGDANNTSPDSGLDSDVKSSPSPSPSANPQDSDVRYDRRQESFTLRQFRKSRMQRIRRDPQSLGDPLEFASGLLGSADLTGGLLGGLSANDGRKDSTSSTSSPGGVGGLSGIVAQGQAEQIPPTAVATALPTELPTTISSPLESLTSVMNPLSSSESSASKSTATVAPARHAVKQDSEKCTPSPAKPMPPSATWTTCPYIRKDGKVNPDVRTLPGVGAIQHVSEAINHNAISFALRNDRSFSKNVVRFVKAFFIDEKTRMNPNVNFGQIVRGPGSSGQKGSWTGILDLRGLVKVLNGLTVIKAAESPDWSADIDGAMNAWMTSYSNWLSSSALGKEVASRPNNHVTFYVSQVAAAKLYSGDKQGAADVLQHFFDNAFKDQIAKSGEQPFEASRTRPQHYRAFNLEALIVNAKLGDQVSKNFWIARSKYGSTIQDAVDYAMKKPFTDEDPTDLAPHVAAVAAQYGDPSGKYAAFLRKYQPDYQSQPFWFYDQSQAFKNSNSKRQKRRVVWARDDNTEASTTSEAPEKTVPFECPEVFTVLGPKVPLDLDLYVTCEELRGLYEST